VEDAAPCLSVTALLPAGGKLRFVAEPAQPAAAAGPKIEFLWHADEGRYVVMRSMPVTDFPDEASVMDAILDTSDRARAWYAAACASQESPSTLQ
jgi:hypothetical protein